MRHRRAISGVVVLGLMLATPAAAERLACTVENGSVQSAGQSVKAVELSPAPNQGAQVINLGDHRNPVDRVFTLQAAPQLPRGVEKRIDLVASDPVRSDSQAADHVRFPEPKFSTPLVSGNRQRIRFRMCIDPPDDLPAGSYTTTVDVEGPPGLEATAVTLTINAKDEELFIAGVIVAIALSLVTLLYKEASSRRAKLIDEAGGDAQKRSAAERWGPPWKATLKDLGWWATTLFALGATFGTLIALWEANPAWGAEHWGAVGALIGTALAAVGARAIFTPGRSP